MSGPPDARDPTAAQLRGDIDAGRTGDKVPGADPAAAPLGTDDEAAGTPPPPGAVAEARRLEAGPAVEHPNAAEPDLAPDASTKRSGPAWAGVAMGAAAAAALVALMIFAR